MHLLVLTCHLLGESVAGGAYRFISDHNLLSFSVAVLTMSTMSLSPSSILEDGPLKPGIYKIQNIHNETFLDIEIRSRDVCCRPATDLEEGRGIVRR